MNISGPQRAPMSGLMATGAKLRLVANDHRFKLIAGVCVLVAVALGITLVFTLAVGKHHDGGKQILPTLTMLNSSSSRGGGGWEFSMEFSDPSQVRNNVDVIPMLSSSNNATILGKPLVFPHPDGRQRVFSGFLTLSLPPPLLSSSMQPLRPSVHVSTLLDGVRRGWSCPALLTSASKCSIIA